MKPTCVTSVAFISGPGCSCTQSMHCSGAEVGVDVASQYMVRPAVYVDTGFEGLGLQVELSLTRNTIMLFVRCFSQRTVTDCSQTPTCFRVAACTDPVA